MEFEKDVARYQRELAAVPKAAPVPCTNLQPWHDTLVAALRDARVATVPLYMQEGSVQRNTLIGSPHTLNRYAKVADGWVLNTRVEYRDGYLTGASFTVGPKLYGTAQFTKPYKRSGGVSRGISYTGSRSEGIPRGGAWVLSDGGPFYANLGAALIVAILRSGRSLRSIDHGAWSTI